MTKFRKPFYAMLLLPALALLEGCSVGMALSGTKEPNLSVIKEGASRPEVELQLGSPVKVATLPNSDTSAVYEYEIGGESSPGRAVAHGAMDVLTLGIWEIIGTPVEAINGDKYTITIVYDSNNRVKNIMNAKK